ncbi:hypothetical protein LXA43DRAFT_1064576 [Ganoderma leucocontextum]|nr:hypothetical protein LXA43DRAFT_1064576 [Ganoderma leucocontextum]
MADGSSMIQRKGVDVFRDYDMNSQDEDEDEEEMEEIQTAQAADAEEAKDVEETKEHLMKDVQDDYNDNATTTQQQAQQDSTHPVDPSEGGIAPLQPENAQDTNETETHPQGSGPSHRMNTDHAASEDVQHDDASQSKRNSRKRKATPQTSRQGAGLTVPWSSHNSQAMPTSCPMGGEGYASFLFDCFREMSELQREQNEYNRQWQEDMLTFVKKLDWKVSRRQGMVGSAAYRQCAQGKHVKADHVQPSNSMASHIMLELPQGRILSPEELERLEEREKTHLTDLQVRFRIEVLQMC